MPRADERQRSSAGSPGGEVATLYEKGRQCLKARRYVEAGCFFRECVRREPGHVRALAELALVLLTTSHLHPAATTYREALRLSPGNPGILNGLGNCYRAEGDFTSAAAYYEQAIRADPAGAEPMYNLAQLGHHANASLTDNLRRLYDSGNCNGQARALVCFALGRVHEQHQDLKRAYPWYAEANAVQFPLVGYEEARYAALFEQVEATFTGALLRRRREVDCKDGSPIFVLGMPRSGTSLVEQFLASHSRVYGAGETSILPWIAESYLPRVLGVSFPGGVASLDAGGFAALADVYLERLSEYCPVNPGHVVCKTPTNYFLVGLIRLLFPRAPIIHCVRDPMDTCWSLFRQYFGSAHGYCYDQGTLGRYYRRYQRLMDHWHAVLPGEIFDVRYEELVERPEETMRAMLDYCGLVWEDSCRAFYRTRRVVNTASASQVRQPIYRHSMRSWLPLAEELAALRGALQEG